MTTAERRAIVESIVREFGEDYLTIGQIVKALRTTGVSLTTLRNDVQIIADAHPEYFGAGLSINWWVGEVARLSA